MSSSIRSRFPSTARYAGYIRILIGYLNEIGQSTTSGMVNARPAQSQDFQTYESPLFIGIESRRVGSKCKRPDLAV